MGGWTDTGAGLDAESANKNLCPVPGIKSQLPDCLARSLVYKLNEVCGIAR